MLERDDAECNAAASPVTAADTEEGDPNGTASVAARQLQLLTVAVELDMALACFGLRGYFRMTANTSAKSGLRSVRQKGINPGLEGEIRRRAYELYEQRGGGHGHDLANWLRAEKGVTQKKRSRRVAA